MTETPTMKPLPRRLPSAPPASTLRAAALQANAATDRLVEPLARRFQRRIRPLTCAAMLLAAVHSASAQNPWVSQGPGPIINGSGEGITSPQGMNPNSGAIVAFAILPGSADTIYAATVNGGVWMTTNATAATPNWTALTDQALPNLSLNSIGISPLDPNTIFVGAGLSSGYARLGGQRFGVGRSTDGGKTWVTVNLGTTPRMMRNKLQGDVRSIVPTTIMTASGQVVLAAVSDSPYGQNYTGVFRSADGGNTFTQLTMATNGIPVGSTTDLVGDPGNPNRFYAGVLGTVYISNDAGASWTSASGPGFGVITGGRVLLSVHNSAAANVVYAMVTVPGGKTTEDVPPGTSSVRGTLNNVYRSTNQGATWTALGVPMPEIFGSMQGGIHGCIAADPQDPTIVYINGDSQATLNSVNGTKGYSANIFRNVNGTYQNMVGNGNGGGANGTAPHSDSRAMAFDANGDLVETNDGGINKLVNPNGTTTPANDGTRRWTSLNGNINPSEVHSAVFDPLTRVPLFGTQDNGSASQMTPGNLLANHLAGGDGGDVDVDADQNAHPGTSIRYVSSQNLFALRRITFDTTNNQLGEKAFPALQITAGTGSGQRLYAFEPKLPFVTPFKVNRVRPARMMIGSNAYLYESMDQGETLTNLIATGGPVGDLEGNSPISYGGRNADNTPNEGAFFAGAGDSLLRRTADGQPVTTVPAYQGGKVYGVVMDPQNTANVFVLNNTNRIFGSFDGGATFSELTANLGTLCPSVRSLELFSAANGTYTVLIAAGEGGVFKLHRPGSASEPWKVLGTGLPKAVVFDVRYDYVNKMFVAGTLGRGLFTLTDDFIGSTATPVPASSQSQAAPRPDVIEGPEVRSQAHPASRTTN